MTGRLIRQRPITAFLLITFAVSYVLGMPFHMVVSSMLDPSSLAGLYLPRVVTVMGPGVAAVLVTAVGGGHISTSQLLVSLQLQPGDIPWIASITVVGLVCAAVAFALAGVSLTMLLALETARPALLIAHVMLQVAVIGLGEEIGWRGWLLPSMSTNRSFLAATVLTGSVWAGWHLPLFFAGAAVALSFTLLVASAAIVLSWVWHRTAGATGLVALAHGMINGPFAFLEHLIRPLPDGAVLTVRAFGYLAVCYAVVALALAFTGRSIWRQHGPVRPRT